MSLWPSDDVNDSQATPAGLLALLDEARSLLIAVATGGPKIHFEDDRYRRLRRELNQGLNVYGITPPFPWKSLSDWRGKWTAGDMPTYQDRREYISHLARPVISQLQQLSTTVDIEYVPLSEPKPTWTNLNERLRGARDELRRSKSHDDLQDVGRWCREILIDLGKLVFDDDMVSDPPKAGDAKARLNMFLDKQADGPSKTSLRKVVRSAWELAQAVTHSDNIDRVDALAALQSTFLIVRVVQELHETSP